MGPETWAWPIVAIIMIVAIAAFNIIEVIVGCG